MTDFFVKVFSIIMACLFGFYAIGSFVYGLKNRIK